MGRSPDDGLKRVLADEKFARNAEKNSNQNQTDAKSAGGKAAVFWVPAQSGSEGTKR